jgi:hypothetical protein
MIVSLCFLLSIWHAPYNKLVRNNEMICANDTIMIRLHTRCYVFLAVSIVHLVKIQQHGRLLSLKRK